MSEVEFREKYKSLINSQHDIYFNSNASVDYSEVINGIIVDHENIKKSISTCLDIERLYPKNSEYLKSLVNDLIIDFITKDSLKSEMELYFCLYTNIQMCKNEDVTKRNFIEIINDSCHFDKESFLKEILTIDKAKKDFHIKTNRRKVVAIDSNGYRIYTEEIKSLYKYLSKYEFIVKETIQGINDTTLIPNGNGSNILSMVVVGVVLIGVLAFVFSVGLFGILFLIGAPGLIISICKKAGK